MILIRLRTQPPRMVVLIGQTNGGKASRYQCKGIDGSILLCRAWGLGFRAVGVSANMQSHGVVSVCRRILTYPKPRPKNLKSKQTCCPRLIETSKPRRRRTLHHYCSNALHWLLVVSIVRLDVLSLEYVFVFGVPVPFTLWLKLGTTPCSTLKTTAQAQSLRRRDPAGQLGSLASGSLEVVLRKSRFRVKASSLGY